MINVRTDLALETREMYKFEFGKEVDGLVVDEQEINDIKITTVDIVDEQGEKIMGKPKGKYITLEMPEYTHYDGDIKDKIAHILGETLSKIIEVGKDSLALVVGLGNWKVTPDALGPDVVEKIMITRHLKKVMPDKIDDSVRPVCAIAPGVLGITGIETGEIIKSLVDKIKPDIVICVDALASRRLKRVARTIQISNTGISPGAGVGNNRMEINQAVLGVPVISIGVPTVVDAATVANDAMDLVLDEMINQSTKGGEFYKMLKSVNKNEKNSLIKSLLAPYVGDLMVTPKEVDDVIDSVSKIISDGINLALQPSLDMEDINKFLN